MSRDVRAHRRVDSPLGPLTLVATNGTLSGLYMEAQRHRPEQSTFGVRDDTVLREVVIQLEEYFAGTRTDFELETAPPGTAFQRAVWRELSAIPYGHTTTYGALADRLGVPRASRAVGAANGRNPIGVIVPCHRVLGANGDLTGYGGGLERKRRLLDFERGALLW